MLFTELHWSFVRKGRAYVAFYILIVLYFQVSDKDDVSVGRIRQDLSQDDNRGYNNVYSYSCNHEHLLFNACLQLQLRSIVPLYWNLISSSMAGWKYLSVEIRYAKVLR